MLFCAIMVKYKLTTPSQDEERIKIVVFLGAALVKMSLHLK